MQGIRRREEPHPNHERWLVSYADFITLMFAFFVVMYASSQSDKDKARQLSQAVEKALSEGSVPPKINEMMHGKVKSGSLIPGRPPTNLDKLEPSLDELRHALRGDIASGRLEVRMEKRGLVISLRQAAFFPTGDALVATAGYEALATVAKTLARIPNPVRLEGHTDSVPIKNGRFPSNWHLSAARSIAMLDLLTEKFGIPEARLAAVGYADTVAVDTNETEEGRARNRRVDIMVLNENSYSREPVQERAAPPKGP
ncbi:MAG: flagellar motor protein MotB [Bryobacteraceae bacterium]|nr:flagellar motor protein MotB [Bryobacteraceae bacterium]